MNDIPESEMGPLVPAKDPLQMHRDALRTALKEPREGFRKKYWACLQQELGATDLCEIPDDLSARISTMMMIVDARMSAMEDELKSVEEGIGAMTPEQYADYVTEGGAKAIPYSVGGERHYIEARIAYLQKVIDRDAARWLHKKAKTPQPEQSECA